MRSDTRPEKGKTSEADSAWLVHLTLSLLTRAGMRSLLDPRRPSGKKAGPLPDDKMIPRSKAQVLIPLQTGNLCFNRFEFLLKPRSIALHTRKRFLLFRWHDAPTHRNKFLLTNSPGGGCVPQHIIPTE